MSSPIKKDRAVEDSDYEPVPTEKEAIAVGLALANAEWQGDDAFQQGMRLPQGSLRKYEVRQPSKTP